MAQNTNGLKSAAKCLREIDREREREGGSGEEAYKLRHLLEFIDLAAKRFVEMFN